MATSCNISRARKQQHEQVADSNLHGTFTLDGSGHRRRVDTYVYWHGNSWRRGQHGRVALDADIIWFMWQQRLWDMDHKADSAT